MGVTARGQDLFGAGLEDYSGSRRQNSRYERVQYMEVGGKVSQCLHLTAFATNTVLRCDSYIHIYSFWYTYGLSHEYLHLLEFIQLHPYIGKITVPLDNNRITVRPPT